MAGIRVVVFDVYGTLLVSGVGDIGLSSPAARGSVLARLTGGEAGALGENFTRVIEEHHRQCRLGGEGFPEVDIREVWQDWYADCFPARAGLSWEESERLAVRFEREINPTGPMPGLRETIADLREAGLRMGIISNAQFFTPELLVEALGESLESAGFDPTLCLWSYMERTAKPSDMLFRKLLERVGDICPPEGILYIGNDMLNDITPARRVGMRTGLFAGDRRSLRWRKADERCAGVHPDLILTDLSQVIHCV